MNFKFTTLASFVLVIALIVVGCGDNGNGDDTEFTISSITPISAMIGESVTISGVGFSETASENTVTFTGDAEAEVTEASAGELTVTVPEGAQDGPVTVEVDGQSTTSSTEFTVSEEPAPQVPEPYASFPGTKIAEDETWTSDTTLTGPHFVLPGVTLTIEPGVTVEFTYHDGNSDNVGTIITLPADDENFDDEPRPTARLEAEGTANDPIVFTSNRKAINSWGGIIMAGRASTNIPDGGVGNIEGLEDAVQYGASGADAIDDDNSGTLQYVRIEYSGYSIAEGSELQALTLYAVGSGTTIDHVNLYGSSDDGIELFGGTVNVKYLVVWGADDDSFDYDQGWQGSGQFWLAVQRPGADNGFENDGCDDLSDCGGGNGPTSPTISNVTVFGANNSPEKDNFGLKLRENLEGSYNNIIVSNFDGYHFLLDGRNDGDDDDADVTFENYDDGTLELNNLVLQNNGGWEVETEADRYSESFVMASTDNPADLFNNPDIYDFSLPSGSEYLSGGSVPGDSFFDDVSFRGALGVSGTADDWVNEGVWVRWPDN